MTPAAIIFDLDGTLVDSHAEIAATLARAIAERGLAPVPAITRASIGPPLHQLLPSLLPEHDEDVVAAVAGAFMRLYDASDYQATTVYPGIRALLGSLDRASIRAFVATAKRDRPTRRLLAKLELGPFADVACIDSYGAPRSKSELLAQLMRTHGLAPASTWMIGDTVGDLRAARDHGLRAIAAAYGYGSGASLAEERPDATVASSTDLAVLVARAGVALR